MFPEFRELISRLKTEDTRFMNLFKQHNALDEKIQQAEKNAVNGLSADVVEMKKEKLRLKDELYQILRNYKEI